MIQISLKKLVSKKEGLSVVNDIVNAIGTDISIQDADGKTLIGVDSSNPEGKYPVELSGEAIGWVSGSGKAKAVATLVSYLAHKELEKKTLANELLDKYREINLIYEISQKITASLDLKEVAKLVMDEALRLIEATSGTVLLLNEETQKLESIADFGKESHPKTTYWPLDGIVGSVVATGRGEIVNDVSSDPRFVNMEQVSSLICVPLKTKQKVIGAIALGSCCTVTYTAAELKLLTLLASQAASAIEIALLHLQEKQLLESRREALLFRLASQIRHSLNLDTILETAVSEIRTLLQIDCCTFSWYRPKILCIDAHCPKDIMFWQENQPAWEVVNEARNPEKASLKGYYSAKESGCLTQKVLDMEMVRVSEVETLSDPVMRQFIAEWGFTSFLAVPIQTRSGAIGVVSCGNSTEVRAWCDSEVELLQAVANQLAIAIDQAELYNESATAAQIAQAQAQQLQIALHELQQTQAQLIQSEKMSSLGQMVAGVAHEINNPVNFIYGNLTYAHQYTSDLLGLVQLYQQQYPMPGREIQAYSENIDLDFLTEDFPKLLSSMHLGVDRIRSIVSSLRNFSRLDQAQMKPVDIHEGIDSTLLILEHRLKPVDGHPGIQVIKEYGKLPSVECYAGQLNQVLMNIIANAIDALETQAKPGIITISTEVKGEVRNVLCENESHPPSQNNSPKTLHPSEVGALAVSHVETLQPTSLHPHPHSPKHIVIRIRDNGPGMTEAVRTKLFDPFFTTKPVGKGTGLGLSISYQIVVQKHGGAIECISKPGEGAEFWIQIPVRPLAAITPNIHRKKEVSGRGVAASR